MQHEKQDPAAAPKFGDLQATVMRSRSRSRSPYKRVLSPHERDEEIEVELTAVRPNTGLHITDSQHSTDDEGALELLQKSSVTESSKGTSSGSGMGRGNGKRSGGSQYISLGAEDDHSRSDALLEEGSHHGADTAEHNGTSSTAASRSNGSSSHDGDDNLQYVLSHEGAGGRKSAPCAWISGRTLVYLCAVCSSLCNVLLGYDVGVISGAKEFFTDDLRLTGVQTEVVVGSLNIVAAFGGLVAGKAADVLGRKPTIALACVVFIAGAFVMTVSQGFVSLLIGRVVTGVGVGCAMVISPVFIAELAPADVRGMLVSLSDISINLGILLGYASSLACDSAFESDSSKWRAMVGLGTLPPALILACLLVMPESPRWLVSQGKLREARDVLRRVLGNDREALDGLKEMCSTISQDQREASWSDVLLPYDRVIRAAMLIGLGLGFWQQASGSEAAVYYSPEVLRHSGWEGRSLLLGNMAVGGFKLAGEVVAFFLLDRVGRRPLFIVSSVLVTLCLLGISMSFQLGLSGIITLVWLSAFMFCFSLGLGPVTFVVASEIFPLAVRSKAMSLVVFTNRFMSGVIALSYVSIARALTPAGSFAAFAGLSAASVWFYASCVPETAGKTLEEITAGLAEDPSGAGNSSSCCCCRGSSAGGFGSSHGRVSDSNLESAAAAGAVRSRGSSRSPHAELSQQQPSGVML